MEVKIKRVFEDAYIPSRGSERAAGYDLYAYKPNGKDATYIQPHTSMMIHTGVAMSIPDGYFGAVYSRSGMAKKHGLRLGNCVAVIDCDFRGEIMAILHNDSEEGQVVSHGDRIAQIVITPYLPIEFTEVDELDSTVRGDGGFGSTGK